MTRRDLGARGWLAIWLAGALVFAACQAGQAPVSQQSPTSTAGEGTTQAAPRPAKTLTVAAATIGDERLDPSRSAGGSFFMNDLLFDPLVGTSKDDTGLSRDTGLAKDWTVSPDGLTYRFTLRESVKFSDGVSVTSEDAKFSLERLASPETDTPVGRPISNAIAGVTTIGPSQLEVKLKAPMLSFLEYLSRDGAGFVVPKAYVQKVGDKAFNASPIGSGPYKIDKHQVGASIELVPSSESHLAVGTLPFQRIIFRRVPEESSRVAMLTTGEADFVDIGIESAGALRSKGARILSHSLQNSIMLNYTGQLKEGSPLRDLNVRKALSFAIDRDGINKALWGGLGRTTQSPFPGQIGGQPRAADPYDPAQAKALLAKTRYGPGGTPLTIVLYAANEAGAGSMLPMLLAIQSTWKGIGVQTDVVFSDSAVLRQRIANKELPANAIDISAQSGRRDFSGSSVYICTGVITRLCDPQFDRIYPLWRSASTQEQYETLARQAETYMMDNYYAYPVLTTPDLYATTNQAIFMGTNSVGLIHLRLAVRGLLYTK